MYDFLACKLQESLPFPRKSTNGGIGINCPMCEKMGQRRPDTRQRCGVKIFGDGSLAINCFNCGFVTRWRPGVNIPKKLRGFMSSIGISELEISRLNFKAWQLTGQTTEQLPKIQSFNPEFNESQLPPNSLPITDWKSYGLMDNNFQEVTHYVEQRGFNNLTNFYWTPETKFNRSIIVPFTHNEKTVGWVARAIDPNKVRYFAETQPHYLFNNEALGKRRKYAIVVEGVFDALSIDGIATLGAKLSVQQSLWLKESNKTIVVLPDRDEKGQHLIDLALANDFMVSFPTHWDHDIKDANDAMKKYGKLYTVMSILNNATNNKLKINILRNKWTIKN